MRNRYGLTCVQLPPVVHSALLLRTGDTFDHRRGVWRFHEKQQWIHLVFALVPAAQFREQKAQAFFESPQRRTGIPVRPAALYQGSGS